jgi:hypothetical protein
VGLSENRVPRKNGLIIIITWNKHVLFVALKSSHFQTRMFFSPFLAIQSASKITMV